MSNKKKYNNNSKHKTHEHTGNTKNRIKKYNNI